MIKAALHLLSPAGRRQRLSVLIFHRVLPQKDTLHTDLPDVAEFDRTIGWVCRWFNVLPLDQAMQRWRDQSLPARAAAITFDDGYADNLLHAVPVLRRHGVTGTFFIATGYLDGGRMWNDSIAEAIRCCSAAQLDLADLGLGCHPLGDMAARRQAVAHLLPKVKYLPAARRSEVTGEIARRAAAPLPDKLMMTTPQLRAMRDAGMQIGAHTVSHPILACTDPATARTELSGSKRHLEDLLQQPVDLLAYPNGVPGKDYTALHAGLAREVGFVAAFTTAAGAASVESSAYEMPRFTPWDQTRLRFGLRMARNLTVVESRSNAATP
ncbi:putative xylanase/chitin deacetylase [Burkholderiales bacterium JOSHI_001]|nr:putative xylanase/chitin deacetylase [Burkholderiales bacterium JOSHI_001]